MKLAPITPSALPQLGNVGSLNKPADTSDAFGNLVTDALKRTATAQKNSAEMTLAVANGDNVPMHEVIQAVNRAETTLQTMLTVRDKAVEAYQQVMRMPI